MSDSSTSPWLVGSCCHRVNSVFLPWHSRDHVCTAGLEPLQSNHWSKILTYILLILRTSWVWDAIAHKQGGDRSVVIGKSIEWLCMEDSHSVKLSRLLAFDCASIERLSVPQPNSCLLLGEPTNIFSSALSGSSWADTPSYRNVLYPAGDAFRSHMGLAQARPNYPVRCAQGRVKRLSPSIYIFVCRQKTGLFAVLLLENRHEIALYRSAS